MDKVAWLVTLFAKKRQSLLDTLNLLYFSRVLYFCLACHCNDLHHPKEECDPNRITNKSTNWIGWWDERFKKRRKLTTRLAKRLEACWDEMISLSLSVYFVIIKQNKIDTKKKSQSQCWVFTKSNDHHQIIGEKIERSNWSWRKRIQEELREISIQKKNLQRRR